VTPAVRALRDRLRDAILAVPGVELTGHRRERLPNHLSVIVREVEGSAVAMALDLDGIACSTGSACTSGDAEPSHVLTAMGYPEEEARGALRLSLGRTTTADEIDQVCRIAPATIARLRAGAATLAADPSGVGVG